MDPVKGLERASKFAPYTSKLLNKKGIENLKRNKHRSDKRRAKYGVPNIAPSPALD